MLSKEEKIKEIEEKIENLLERYGKSIYKSPEDVPQEVYYGMIFDYGYDAICVETCIVNGICHYHIMNNTKFKEIAEKYEYYEDRIEYTDDVLYNKLRYYYTLLGYYKYHNNVEYINNDELEYHLQDDIWEVNNVIGNAILNCAKKYHMIPYNIKGEKISYEDGTHEIAYFKMEKTFKIAYTIEYSAECETEIKAESEEEAMEKFCKKDIKQKIINNKRVYTIKEINSE